MYSGNANGSGGSGQAGNDASPNSTNLGGIERQINDTALPGNVEQPTTRASFPQSTGLRSGGSEYGTNSDCFRTKNSRNPGGSSVRHQRQINSHQEDSHQNILTPVTGSEIPFGYSTRSRGRSASRGPFKGALRGRARPPPGYEFHRRELRSPKPSPGEYGNIPGLVRPPFEYTERTRTMEFNGKYDSIKRNSLSLSRNFTQSGSPNGPCEPQCGETEDDHFPSGIIEIRKSRTKSESLTNIFQYNSDVSQAVSGETTPSINFQQKQQQKHEENIDKFPSDRRTSDTEYGSNKNHLNTAVKHSPIVNPSMDLTDTEQQEINEKDDDHRQKSDKRNGDKENPVPSSSRQTPDAQ